MSDDDFDSFDADDDGVQAIEEDEDSDRHQHRDRRDLSIAMTQKLFGNVGGASGIHVAYDESAYVAPRNRFEEILADENVRIVQEHDDGLDLEKFIVFGGTLNHDELCRNLEKRMETDRGEVFGEFEVACSRNDHNAIALYLSPSKSQFGLQDTVFRAFLQIRATQTKSFHILLRHLNSTAQSKSTEHNLALAQTCVAHMRHLNRLHEPNALFASIFELEWRFWVPGVRNDLISALPEIFTDLSLQQRTALRLNQEIAETQNIPALPEFQFQIVETLRLLRMDASTARQIRVNLCSICMDLDVACVPGVVAFALASLLTPGGGKSDDDETQFHETLRLLSRRLKIDVIVKKKASNKSKADVLICEIFAHFWKFLQLEKHRAWKHIISWMTKKNGKKSTIFVKNEDPEGSEDVPEEVPEDSRAPEDQKEMEEDSGIFLTSFDAFLIFSLLSNSESCPPGFVTAVNSKFLSVPAAFTPKFLKIVDLVVSLKKFSTTHLPALIHVARHAVWSQDSAIRTTMGVSIWKQLLIGTEKKERIRVFVELMKHFSQSETECEVVLEVLAKVIRSTDSGVILEFSEQIQKCIELIHKLSIPNTKRLFQVMLMMNSKEKKAAAPAPASKQRIFDIDEIINRFLTSVSEREKFLGVLALLMKIQVEMAKKHSEQQERHVGEGIARIKGAVDASPRLRGAFYEHLKLVLREHKRAEEIRFFSDWSVVLLTTFKTDFFECQESMDSEDSEGHSKWILKIPGDRQRLLEICPMFELILEMLVLKRRWRQEDGEEDDEMTSSNSYYDARVMKDLRFAFEARLPSADDNDDDDFSTARDPRRLDHHYFVIEWSRCVLNAFLSSSQFTDSSSSTSSSTTTSEDVTRHFKTMIDAEKRLAGGLLLKTGAPWHVPNLKFKELTVVVVEKTTSSGGKRGVASSSRKRKSDETTTMAPGAEEDDDDVVMREEAQEEEMEQQERDLPNVKSQLKSHYTCLKLRPLVHILKMVENKRSCLKYLCDELQIVFDHLGKSKKKPPIFFQKKAPPTFGAPIDRMYHGDAASVWFSVRKATEHVWSIVETVFEFFGTVPSEQEAEDSRRSSQKMHKDLEELGEKALKLMHCVLSGDLFYSGDGEKLSPVERSERKSVIIRIIEKRMFSLEKLSMDSDQARVEIGKFLAKSAEFAPSPAVGVALLNVFDDLKLDEIEQSETRKRMAKYALAYLKKDWSKVDETLWSKGPKYTNAVRDILQHYINLRSESDQLAAIQWILTNKVVQLVPEDDKRKSCVFSQQSDDSMLEKEDQRAMFHCISKTTFGVIFKCLFGCLNTRCLKYDMSSGAARNGGVDEEDTLEAWQTASSCFLILCLLLRINKIRTTAVLTTAIREGKQFLITVAKKSSFIYLMDNLTTTNGNSNFDAICRRVEKILSAVQQGNRVLQSIGTYAKTQKCVHLLKRFPELRAESENCLRVIHSAMVKNECLNAFTVGLVKSRSIDGEIITNEPENLDDSDDE